jgi:hypothetical protein
MRRARWGALSRLLAACAAACAVAAPAPAATTQTYFCDVAQPVVVRDQRRVEVHHVTFALQVASALPGVELQFTCWPSPFVVQTEFAPDSADRSQFVNLNAANLLGLSVRVERRPRGTWSADFDTSGGATARQSRFYVDELRADLDVSALARRQSREANAKGRHEELAQFDALVEATVTCMIENASRSHPTIRKLRLNVVGWDRYRRYTNVYPVAAPTEVKQFRY